MNQNNNNNNSTFYDRFSNLTLSMTNSNITYEGDNNNNNNNNTGQLPVPRFVFGIVAGLWVFMLCAPIIAPTIEKWKANRDKQNNTDEEEDNVELNNSANA